MTQQHPITPPPELIQRWSEQFEAGRSLYAMFEDIYRAGADAELEACCEWLQDPDLNVDTYKLRAARRPKPKSLNSIAMQMLGTIERDGHYIPEITDTIRRALEQLPDNKES
jgi:hypothetical protein